MAGLSISTAWEETKGIIARDGKLYASVALALIVLPQTVAGLFAPRTEADVSTATGVVLAIAILISFAAQIALNRLAIGPSTTVGEAIRRGFARMPIVMLAFIIMVLVLVVVVVLLTILLGVAGLLTPPGAGQPPPAGLVAVLLLIWALLYAIFQLMIPVGAAERGGPVRLLARSWALGRGNYLPLLVFVVIVLIGLAVVWMTGQFVIGSVVVLLFGQAGPMTFAALLQSLVVGVIQAAYTIVAAVMLARIYVQLTGGNTAQPGVPNSGT